MFLAIFFFVSFFFVLWLAVFLFGVCLQGQKVAVSPVDAHGLRLKLFLFRVDLEDLRYPFPLVMAGLQGGSSVLYLVRATAVVAEDRPSPDLPVLI